MRSLWRGSISFGLVHIPVRLYAATEARDVRFHLLHGTCHTRIRNRRYCPSCRRLVEEGELVRGYEVSPERYVVVSDEDLRALPLPTERALEILDFVDLATIDPIYFERSYFVEPAEGGGRAYGLLRRAMAATGRAALVRVALRARESLACLRVYPPGGLALATMFYPDEVRDVRQLEGVRAAPVPAEGRELAIAIQLVEQLSAPFEPDRYHDRYREALLARIE
ncbi:MAG: Ku protein, partial [Clostridia bacterium]|nr:Ku protein [Clostridia bacterium]